MCFGRLCVYDLVDQVCVFCDCKLCEWVLVQRVYEGGGGDICCVVVGDCVLQCVRVRALVFSNLSGSGTFPWLARGEHRLITHYKSSKYKLMSLIHFLFHCLMGEKEREREREEQGHWCDKLASGNTKYINLRVAKVGIVKVTEKQIGTDREREREIYSERVKQMS